MSFQNNVLSFESIRASGSRPELKDEHRAVVSSCRQAVFKLAPKLMNEMFESLDDALYELADKAESNIRQTAFFDAMREIRKNRERMEVGFSQQVLKGFDEFWSTGTLPVKPDNRKVESSEDGLSLLGEDDLEEGLALSNMTSRGENRHFRSLYGLNQRFGHLLGWGDLDTKDNPLSPGAICQAFHEKFKVMAVDIPVKLVVYKQFQIHVIDSLDLIYDELNGLLARADVLPQLVNKIRRTSGYQPGAVDASPAHYRESKSEVLGGEKAEDNDLQAELFLTLKQLLSEKRLVASAGGSNSVRLPVIETNDMIQALSALQRIESPAQGQISNDTPGTVDVRANLFQVMGLAQGATAEKKISGNDEDAIDVISMLFDFILEDRNLPDAMKALLARLQIPMLKVAILDKSFFHSKAHPARRLLNVLASAAIGWSEQSGKADGGLYEKMNSIVERVLNEFDKDVELFSRLLEELNAFIQREEQGSRVAEQRVAQVTQGKEQLNSARHRVFEEINNRLFGNDWIPSPVVMLIKDGWRDVLLLLSLRQGDESEEWKSALQLMDKLLWSVQPNPDKNRRQELLNEIPLLLKGLRAGLKEISYDQHKMARVFKELQACHIRCLKGEAHEDAAEEVAGGESGQSGAATNVDAVLSPAVPDAGVDGGVAQSSAAEGQAVHDEYRDQAEQIEVGTWFEIQESSGMKFRAKLSWRSMVSGTCLFVNRKGMKVVEIPVAGFASWLRTGKAVPLNDVGVPLMDRALNAMMDVLKKTEIDD